MACMPFLSQRIGQTPVLDVSFLLDGAFRASHPNVSIHAKLEFYNPSQSVKDRLALHILNQAIQTGQLVAGKHRILAATSGNTGTAVAQLAAALGNACTLITTDKTSAEKVAAMRAYGAEVLVVSSKHPSGHPQNYQSLAKTMHEADPENTFDVDQYDSPWNAAAYEHTLGPEIAQQVPIVTHVVAAASTGGTITGIGRHFKKQQQQPQVKIVLADPAGSVLYEFIKFGTMGVRFPRASHGVEGAGKDTVPGAMDPSVVDDAVRVVDTAAFAMCHRLAKFGVMVGGSAGAALHGAVDYVHQLFDDQQNPLPANHHVHVVVVCADPGHKYLSTIYAAPRSKTMNVALDLAEALVVALEKQQAGSVKLIDFQPPAQLQQMLTATLGTVLSTNADEDCGEGYEVVRKATDLVVKYSMQTGHPRFFNLLWGGVDPAAVFAEWTLAVMNTSMFTYEMSPVFTLLEQALSNALLALVGFDHASSEVTFAPGGAYTNLLGVLLARHACLPESKAHGHSDRRSRPIIFASAHAHYTVARACSVMGVGTDGCIAVPVDKEGRMDAAALDAMLDNWRAEEGVPVGVVATSGTTVLGAFDPLDAIADVCQKHRVWLHVDASWGGAALFSDRTDIRSLMHGVSRADSVGITGTKCLAMPQHCAALLVSMRQRAQGEGHGFLKRAMSMKASADYLFHSANSEAGFDLGDVNLSCGRRNDSFKWWMAWKVHGMRGMAQRATHAWEMAKVVVSEIAALQDDGLVMVPMGAPQGMNVCFWYVPKAMRGVDWSRWNRDEMDAVTVGIRQAMRDEGEMLTNHARVESHMPQCFRHITCNPTSTADDHRQLIRKIVQLGKELYP